MKVVFYHSETCPACKVLEIKLKAKKIEYESIVDPDVLIQANIKGIPTLEVDGARFEKEKAVKWVNEYNG